MTEQAPPYDVLGLIDADAERQALARMMADTESAVAIAEALDPSEFADPRRGTVFEAIRNLLLGVERIDVSAVLAECKHVMQVRDTQYRITEADIRGLQLYTDSAGRLISTIKQLAALRRYTEFSFWLVNEIQMRPDLVDLHGELQERLQHLAPPSTNTNFMYGWDTIPTHDRLIKQRIDETAQGVVSRFDYPWASWNRIVRPLREGMVGIIAAPDGIGKTTYLEEIAEHWARVGKNVIYVHLEDARPYKFDRRLVRHSLVPIERIEEGRLDADDKQKMSDGRKRIASFAERLHYFDAAGETMHDIVRELESRIRENICDCIVFDYIDKVRPSRAQSKLYGTNGWERQADDMETLKTFAEKNSIVVLTATQGNKSMQSGGVQTRQAIQGSGQKSQKAQLVVILTRDIIEDDMRDAQGHVIAEAGEYSPLVDVRIDKQNRGRTGQFRQYLIGQYFRVVDINNTTKEQ